MAKQSFTAGRIGSFQCPTGRRQAFLWDAKAPGLGLRVTAARTRLTAAGARVATGGARSYIFQGRLLTGESIRITIGEPLHHGGGGTWSIPAAQAEARRLQALIDQGRDPRAEREEVAARDAKLRADARAARAQREVLGLDAWGAYLEDRRGAWGERTYQDHVAVAAEGGRQRLRANSLTKAGPLYSLLNRPLAEVDAAAVAAWAAREAEKRPGRVAIAFRLLRAFIAWCAEHRAYRGIVTADACKGRKLREILPTPKAKQDVLQREQLAPWFAEVRKLPPTMAAYLQLVLLTGARREELAGLRWEGVDFQWQALRIRDKVEGERMIPLTPYVAALLRVLKARSEVRPKAPRRLRQADPEAAQKFEREWKPSPWVFASPGAAGGRLREPRIAHNRALAAAGLPPLTIHGLRRSFGTLAEWCEVPVGIVAQIMGHKPTALAEKHYRVRPLDLLRKWHERIEVWILKQTGIEQPMAGVPLVLRAVAGSAAS